MSDPNKDPFVLRNRGYTYLRDTSAYFQQLFVGNANVITDTGSLVNYINALSNWIGLSDTDIVNTPEPTMQIRATEQIVLTGSNSTIYSFPNSANALSISLVINTEEQLYHTQIRIYRTVADQNTFTYDERSLSGTKPSVIFSMNNADLVLTNNETTSITYITHLG